MGDMGQTTAPSRVARENGEARRVVGLQWVFPEYRATPFLAERVLLGRGDDCDGLLPGRETSRHHAEVLRVGPVFALNDLGSRNGVFRNGERIVEAALSLGDVIRLGDWVALVVDSLVDSDELEIAPGLIGGGALRRAVAPAHAAAGSDLPIVVQGETGTGKECVARAIHEWSGRAGSFLAVNCAALPETLAEAELFGYRKGAFTGASRDAPGYFRAAHRGTLLLDEVIDLPAPVQAKLLRVIECGEVIPLGETRPRPVDVRLVVAAQFSLHQAVADRRFRADLLARLEGLAVELPPLRERREDVPKLFLELLRRHFGGRPPAVEATLVERLCLHDWPFNVREVVQLARRMAALHGQRTTLGLAQASGLLTERRDMPRRDSGQKAADSGGRKERRNAVVLGRLREALVYHAGNVSRAASAVGISRQRAYRLLKSSDEIDLEALRIPQPPDR